MDKLQFALNTTFVGMVVVFLSLILISFIIFASSKLLGIGKSQKKTNSPSIVANQAEESNSAFESTTDSELIAVLTAAVLSSMKDGYSSNIRIKSFRRVFPSSPIWNLAGRSEYLSGKL
jgi:Na+-transporting methylmalonyl-CoA/oxaloacetate decarboxylase gamma subunit